MSSFRRTSKRRRARETDQGTVLSPSTLSAPTTPHCGPVDARLLDNHNVPLWYRHSGYIRMGYRPVTTSIRRCFYSLGYMHNETVNIYTHLVPAAAALLGNGILVRYFASHFPNASWTDQKIFHVYLTTSLVCFGISSAYHTLLCHSPYYNDFWGRLDYVAIAFQILGSFVPGLYVGFYCEPLLQRIYWTMIGTLALFTALVVVNSRLQGRKWRLLRVLGFVATGFSAFAPIVHAALIFPYDQLDKQAGLRYYYIEGVLILIGVIFYITHFPESWKPVRFDILGASHQTFHIFVVLGAVVHLYGILTAFEWNYQNPRC